jgi:hypothetical protein
MCERCEPAVRVAITQAGLQWLADWQTEDAEQAAIDLYLEPDVGPDDEEQ